MVEQNIAGNEFNSDTTISLNLSSATVAFSDDIESDNHSQLSEECQSLELSNNFLPPNTSVNIENSSDVIVGPVTQFHGPVTIYQNTHNNTPTIKDKSQFLANGFVEEKTASSATTLNSAKLVASESLSGQPVNIPFSRKKITIISLLILVIIILLTVIINYIVGIFINLENNRDNNEIDFKDSPDEPQISGSSHKMIYRSHWGGKPPLYERPQKVPAKYVIISHTAGAECFSIADCSQQMLRIQTLHVTSGSPDIGYNFLIGGDANIYVARGWDNHNFHMNLNTIGICFIGNYVYNTLNPGMIEATQQLLKQGVEKGKLDKDYVLVGHNQTFNTLSPGENVYRQIKFWPHFSSDSLNDVEKPV